MRPIDADALIPLIQEDKIEGKTLDIVKALGDGLQAETLNQACDRHIKIINGLPTIATTQEVHGTAENFTAPMEKGKTMPDWIGISIFMILIFFLGYVWGRIERR